MENEDKIVNLHPEKTEQVIEDALFENAKVCFAIGYLAILLGYPGAADYISDSAKVSIFSVVQQFVDESTEEEKSELLEMTDGMMAAKDIFWEAMGKVEQKFEELDK